MQTNLKSRKFILIILFSAMGFALVLLGKLGADWWAGFVTIGLGMYNYANVEAKKAEQPQMPESPTVQGETVNIETVKTE